ncbi:MAG: hypothetical protein RLZZ414_246 [Bacteroidota bacterium]|jgi:hypothetical protein
MSNNNNHFVSIFEAFLSILFIEIFGKAEILTIIDLIVFKGIQLTIGILTIIHLYNKIFKHKKDEKEIN